MDITRSNDMPSSILDVNVEDYYTDGGFCKPKMLPCTVTSRFTAKELEIMLSGHKPDVNQ
ncbi:hypothetical protein K435DRAFT_875369 [Dendrothele bispora CBS 962.96]|uniref:Uncharacterized protein n=1 Tax=Dendrothele bispora (strain CBS 962.96) TaxID=1314807 RepID=A0A4S8KVL7_DENBC|nr:hypothetical protein K435DRAFT_875369 [Dendrothele bispora CBS 962.96]